MLPKKRDVTNYNNIPCFPPLMALYTKCIFLPADPSDGTRISVMSRHTKNDGLTPEPRITNESYDEWRKELAPPPELIGAYYKRGLSWKEFSRKYNEHIQQQGICTIVSNLANRAMAQDITLLCVEATAEYCHRRLLAEECKRYQPELKIEHR